METNIRDEVEAVLKHKTLSNVDFRRVDSLGDDGFDCIVRLLHGDPSEQKKVNALRLLIRLGSRISSRKAAPRLPEVFEVAADLVLDPALNVRTTAAQMIVGILDLLRTLGQPAEVVGGQQRIGEILRRALERELKAPERKLLEREYRRIGTDIGGR